MQFDLVFEGGGAKGMVFVGAMQEFEAAGNTYDRLLGTSAGAITAALLAAGYTSQRMLDALGEEEDGRPVFAGFMAVPGPFDRDAIKHSVMVDYLKKVNVPLVPESVEEYVEEKLVEGLLRVDSYRHLFSFVEKGGWYSAARFIDWMTEKLNTAEDGSATGYGSMTLLQFFEATGREICLVASDTTAERMLVLNHRTAPDCPLVWAIRMSMSIPLVWDEVEWREEWGRYRDQDITGHTVVDGGMLSNFPIELLVSEQPQTKAVMGEKKSENVLGLLIDESLPVTGAPTADPQAGGFQWGRLQTAKRIMALIDTMTKAHDKNVIEVFEGLVARLPAKGYGTTEFSMSAERRDALVEAGRKAMKDYLAERSAPMRRPKGRPLTDEERCLKAADRVAASILAL